MICGALKPKTARRYEFFIKRSSRKVCGRRRVCWMMAADMSHRQQRPWPELGALFLVCRVNGFRAGRRGRRSLAAFSSQQPEKLGCSLCCRSRGAVCHFPSSPWAGDREMDDICSVAALLSLYPPPPPTPHHTNTHRERARGNISPSHTRGANKHTPTPSLSFFSRLPFTLLNTLARTVYDCLSNTPPLCLPPLATEPISVVSGGMESSQA